MRITSVPSVWEVWDGDECIGWVEEMYKDDPKWTAEAPDEADLGRHKTREHAEKAVKKHYQSKSR